MLVRDRVLIILPDGELVSNAACGNILQHLPDEPLPVHDHDAVARKHVLARRILLEKGIANDASHASLDQMIGTCQNDFFRLHGQPRLFRLLRILERLESHGGGTHSGRIGVLHHIIGCDIEASKRLVLSHHILADPVKMLRKIPRVILVKFAVDGLQCLRRIQAFRDRQLDACGQAFAVEPCLRPLLLQLCRAHEVQHDALQEQ